MSLLSSIRGFISSKRESPLEYADFNSDDDNEEASLTTGISTHKKNASRGYQRNLCWVLFHGVVLIGYTTVWAIFMENTVSCNRGAFEFSPAKEAISYLHTSFNNTLTSPSIFKGDRNNDIDEAWREITTKHMYFRLKQEERDSLGLESEMPVTYSDEEGGYMASLDVFHQLHCLDRIRKYVRSDQYTDNANPGDFQLTHIDHCIDTIREMLMCKADVSVVTYDWIESYGWPWPNFHIGRECRDWSKIVDWTKKPGRFVKSVKGPILTHPTLGISWPQDGSHDNLAHDKLLDHKILEEIDN
ncbi:hypothetical protein GGR57DRAFT_498616 [Xylariaceae sp. FL1272]|nr:hypothetical protein GGR57DRAFT_498616 [Xylariaceae sp. FL1272]